MTKSPITWVKTFGFTIALGRPFSFLLLLLSKLLLGDEAALHVIGTVVVPLVTIPLLPVPPMQLSITSATDVDVVVNVVLFDDVVNDDILLLSTFTAAFVAVVVVAVVSIDFRSVFDASSPDGIKIKLFSVSFCYFIHRTI